MFLELSGVLERLQNGLSTQVLEIGFGLGLNCLLTADAALNHRANLEYHAFEHDLVTRKALESLGYRNHLSCPELVDRLHTGLFEHAERGTGVPAGSPAEIDTARHIMLGRSKSEPTVDLTLLLSDATANMCRCPLDPSRLTRYTWMPSAQIPIPSAGPKRCCLDCSPHQGLTAVRSPPTAPRALFADVWKQSDSQ